MLMSLKAGRLELVGHGSHFTFCGLRLEELRQDGEPRFSVVESEKQQAIGLTGPVAYEDWRP